METKFMGCVLITGITGFLGKALTKKFLKEGYKVVGTGHSEYNVQQFRHEFPDVPVFAIDIADSYTQLINLFGKYNVDYVIHSAAFKHVSICEKNPSRAIDVNVVGSKHVVKACVDYGIKNAIAVSTDKAVNPKCTYGMTKKLMEEMFIENNFGVFQGVNFLFSTGSVLDVWDNLKQQNKQILANFNAVRFFCKIDEVCQSIIEHLLCRGRFTVEKTYKIKITDLRDAYCEYHKYDNTGYYVPLNVEKDVEDLPDIDLVVVVPDKKDIKKMLKKHYEENK